MRKKGGYSHTYQKAAPIHVNAYIHCVPTANDCLPYDDLDVLLFKITATNFSSKQKLGHFIDNNANKSLHMCSGNKISQ